MTYWLDTMEYMDKTNSCQKWLTLMGALEIDDIPLTMDGYRTLADAIERLGWAEPEALALEAIRDVCWEVVDKVGYGTNAMRMWERYEAGRDDPRKMIRLAQDMCRYICEVMLERDSLLEYGIDEE